MDNKTLLTTVEFVFNEFATGTENVAAQLKVDLKTAYRVLSKLEDAGVVTGIAPNERDTRKRRGQVGSTLTWQTNMTYDSNSLEEVLADARTRLGVVLPMASYILKTTDGQYFTYGGLIQPEIERATRYTKKPSRRDVALIEQTYGVELMIKTVEN